jgi:hypothetical protein
MGHVLPLPYTTKTSPGAVIFGQYILFEILFLADWNKIGEHMQYQTNPKMQDAN